MVRRRNNGDVKLRALTKAQIATFLKTFINYYTSLGFLPAKRSSFKHSKCSIIITSLEFRGLN